MSTRELCILTLNADSVLVKDVIGRADTLFAGRVEDEALGAIADAPAVLNDKAEVEPAGDALPCGVDHVTRGTHALQVLVQNQALARRTRFH